MSGSIRTYFNGDVITYKQDFKGKRNGMRRQNKQKDERVEDKKGNSGIEGIRKSKSYNIVRIEIFTAAIKRRVVW
jgi:hypothetical protein